MLNQQINKSQIANRRLRLHSISKSANGKLCLHRIGESADRRISGSANQRISELRLHVSRFTFHVLLLAVFITAGCGQRRTASTGKLRVVATTTIVGDVVRQVGGDAIELTVLLPYGADPHSFSPSPQDIAKVADADLVFANGLGMEGFLEDLLESAGENVNSVYVSDELDLSEHSDEAHVEDGHDHGGVDPHTWTDPVYVSHWLEQIETALIQHDPNHAAVFRSNVATYHEQLAELDAWIATQVMQIPGDNRMLVCDHAMFAYFANRYGFVQVGTVLPGYSTAAQPSAQALAELEDAIRAYGVRAVFVGQTVNPNLAERVAEDTGVQLVYLYTGSLTAPGGDADTYLDYMRYNVTQMVEALR